MVTPLITNCKLFCHCCWWRRVVFTINDMPHSRTLRCSIFWNLWCKRIRANLQWKTNTLYLGGSGYVNRGYRTGSLCYDSYWWIPNDVPELSRWHCHTDPVVQSQSKIEIDQGLIPWPILIWFWLGISHWQLQPRELFADVIVAT